MKIPLAINKFLLRNGWKVRESELVEDANVDGVSGIVWIPGKRSTTDKLVLLIHEVAHIKARGVPRRENLYEYENRVWNLGMTEAKNYGVGRQYQQEYERVKEETDDFAHLRRADTIKGLGKQRRQS